MIDFRFSSAITNRQSTTKKDAPLLKHLFEVLTNLIKLIEVEAHT